MGKQALPKSARKYIRQEKARIRRQIFSKKEQEQQIAELYSRFLRKKETTPSQPEQRLAPGQEPVAAKK